MRFAFRWQAFRIGELAIAAIPFETFAETGLELKDRSPFPQTFTIELANGSFGYLPTPEQHRLGGYETWLGTNFVEPEASRKIVTALVGLLQTLRQHAPARRGSRRPRLIDRVARSSLKAELGCHCWLVRRAQQCCRGAFTAGQASSGTGRALVCNSETASNKMIDTDYLPC